MVVVCWAPSCCDSLLVTNGVIDGGGGATWSPDVDGVGG